MRLPQQLFERKEDSHKRDFGHVFVVAGSLGMGGAAILASKSALRCGAGLVTLGLPRSLVNVATSYCPEVMSLPLPETEEGTLSKSAFGKIKDFLDKANVLMVGPGLSRRRPGALGLPQGRPRPRRLPGRCRPFRQTIARR